MISRTYFQETFYDMDEVIAQRFAQAIREAWLTGKDFEGEKQKGFFLSKKRGFDDKLYVGNIHRIENHLYWNDEELQDDDQIVNVIVIDGPVTRDGDGCSYGSKDHRDQIMYANTIPQVVGHLFLLNTPGGAASARIDYEQAIADCREKGKPTVAWVDGLCCSAGQLVAALCDRTVAMNGRHTMGCIGTMCAFWAVPHDNVDRDGYRYIELVSVSSPDKNVVYRNAAEGDYEKLQAELNRLGEELRETVRQNRPLVKDEHLTGKTFDADEVMGALVDEIGDYNRAIECVFELAGGTLTAAREVSRDAIAAEETGRKGEQEEEEPAADAAGTAAAEEAGKPCADAAGTATAAEVRDTIADEETGREDTHMGNATECRAERNGTSADAAGTAADEKQSALGPETIEVATLKNDNDMTEEEKKAAEVAEQPATTQEEQAPATEQPVEETAPSNSPEGGKQSTEAPAVEETPAQEEPASEEAPAQEEPAGEEAPAQEETPAQEGTAGEAEALATAEALVAEKDKEIALLKESLATLEGIKDERDKSEEDLRTAWADIAENDKTIETHVATIEQLNGDIEVLRKDVAEKDALIEKLTKQVADLRAEVKEFSQKPAPMVRAESGVPADNGTGEAPKQKRRISSGMSYEEIRQIKKSVG